MLGLAECWESRFFFFHSRLRPSQYLLFFIWHGEKQEKSQDSVEQNLPK